jgi:hypothetical protein
MNPQRADPQPLSRLTLNAQTETIDPAKMIVRSVITTADPDRAGDVVVPKGLRNAAEFLANPVVLWAHQRTMPPIGVCQALDVLPDRIVAETKFSESSPLAADVFRLYAEGVLRGWSIGFLPTKAVPTRSGMRFEEWDLLEYSAVPVPENPAALTMAVQKGLIASPDLRRWLVTDILADLFAA